MARPSRRSAISAGRRKNFSASSTIGPALRPGRSHMDLLPARRRLLPLPAACGERVGVRGNCNELGNSKVPLTRLASLADLSPVEVGYIRLRPTKSAELG